MNIYSIGDLHLSGNANKPMGIFGENWQDHDKKIKENWEKMVKDDDIVLVPGDISWAITLEDAILDLEWINQLPGKKVLIKGNHDYWWKSVSKVRQVLPKGMYALQNNSIMFGDIAIAGTRLWENPDVDLAHHIEWIALDEVLEKSRTGEKKEGNPDAVVNNVNDGKTEDGNNAAPTAGSINPGFHDVDFRDAERDSEKILNREIQRLTLSLSSVPARAKRIIVMLHYPPIDFSFKANEITEILTDYGVDTCIFGHLHSLKRETMPKFPATKWGIDFYLVSCDFIDFMPVKII